MFSLLIILSSSLLCGGLLPQPDVPEGMKNLPFLDKNSLMTPLEAEKKQQFIIFGRPLADPIYPASRPGADERITHLEGFAARGEYETLNFAVYPLENLPEVKISASDWTNGDAIIPAKDVRIQLLTYWNIKYPNYLSHDSYRRMPEYLEDVSAVTARKDEPLRFYITIQVPQDAKAGVYTGSISVNGLKIPIRFTVYDFTLERDPAKNYTAYHSVVFRESAHAEKDYNWLKNALNNEYKAMVNHGINSMPTLYLSYSDGGKKLVIPYLDITLKTMRANNLRPPIPVIGCGMHSLYKKYTGKNLGKHINPEEKIPEELYAEIDRMVKEFKSSPDGQLHAEMVFCPLDEVSPESAEIGRRIYKIFHDNGLKTFATKDPKSDSSAAIIAPYVDVWCIPSYSVDVETVLNDKTHEYWCYPNDNAYQLKDPLIMHKGGRMTYGFGNWRSGFNTLMPWVWRSTNSNHMAQNIDAGGNRLEENGQVTMAHYWTAFREGIDDGRYIYTLQNAIVQRQGGNDPKLNQLLAEAQSLLQEIWDSITPQAKYLNENLWASEEFDARRRQLAAMIAKLYQYPPLNNNQSPSILVNRPPRTPAQDANEALYKQGIAGKQIVETDLGENNFAEWQTRTRELQLDRAPGKLSAAITIDHQQDGEYDSGAYRVGWPRLFREFKRPGLDVADHDFALVSLKIVSNRDEEANDRTPMFFSIVSYTGYKKDFPLPDSLEEGKKNTMLLPMSSFLSVAPRNAFQALRYLQIGVNESAYRHGDKLQIEIDKIAFIKFKSPLIKELSTSSILIVPAEKIHFTATLFGKMDPKFTLKANLKNSEGKIVAEKSLPLAETIRDALDSDSLLLPGRYTLSLEVIAPDQKVAAQSQQAIKAVAL